MGKGKSHKLGDAEAFSRMNFLYQASYLMENHKMSNISANYGTMMKEVSKKVVEKIHPYVKRTLCKTCGVWLVPGESAKIKIICCKKRKAKRVSKRKIKLRDSQLDAAGKSDAKLVQKGDDCKISRLHERHIKPNSIRLHCLHCGYVKHFVQNPNYKLWIEKQEAIVSLHSSSGNNRNVT